jgi:hypothetical protein
MAGFLVSRNVNSLVLPWQSTSLSGFRSSIATLPVAATTAKRLQRRQTLTSRPIARTSFMNGDVDDAAGFFCLTKIPVYAHQSFSVRQKSPSHGTLLISV